MCVQNFKSVALPVPELIEGSRKNGAVPGYTHTLYSPSRKILYSYHTDYLSVCTRFPAIFDWSFEWGLRTPNLGEEEAIGGSGLVPFERALASSYRPSIVTFPLSLRVSEILTFLFSSTPLFHTQHLVFPKFPHFPLGVGGSPFRYKEQRWWANCPCS